MNDPGLYLRTILALVTVLALIGLTTYLIRRFGSDRFRMPRGHRRLGVIEMTTIDARRRLVLVKRDEVEHLILIGGPNDLLIEQGSNVGLAGGIVRGTATQAPRNAALGDAISGNAMPGNAMPPASAPEA